MTPTAIATTALILMASGASYTFGSHMLGLGHNPKANSAPANSAPANSVAPNGDKEKGPAPAVAPNAAPVVAPPSLVGPFPFGVWLQDPMHTINGRTVAWHYKKMGITHWMGMYLWPSEAHRYPGYNVHAAQELKDLGFQVYAGEDMAAVNWNQQHPQFASTFVGYVAGDEPEMTKQFVPAHHPVTFRNNCQMLRQADPTRKLWANFGKGFAKIPWPGYQAFPGPTIQDDHNKYTDFLHIASVSLYGLTDPYEMPNYVGLWTYGKAIDNCRYYVNANPANPGLPVWGFVETGNSFVSSTGFYQTMPIELIKPTVWHMIVHGANGVTYFAHHLYPGGINPTHPINNPEIGKAIRLTNESVVAYGAVLATPSITTTTVTVTGPVGVTALTKRLGGYTYIFAIGEGNVANRYGESVKASISVVTTGTTVEVLNESRTLPLVGGSFIDSFKPYELHIYQIQD